MYTLREFSDALIVNRVLKGRREEYGVLLERHWDIARSVALGYLRNATEAEDVAQEGFVRAFEKLHTLREKGRFRSWLLSIVLHECKDRQKQAQRHQELLEQHYQNPELPQESADLDELLHLLRAEAEQLEPQFREALLLHHFSGVPIREIADLLQLNEAAVRKRLQRGREILGRRLLQQIEPAQEDAASRRRNIQKILLAVATLPVAWEVSAAAGGGVAGALAYPLAGAAVVLVTAVSLLWIVQHPSGIQSEPAITAAGVQLQMESTATLAVPAAPVEPNKQPKTVSGEHTSSWDGSSAIGGNVLDPDTGEAFADLPVWLVRAEESALEEPQETRTDAAGRFLFPQLPPGQYGVRLGGIPGFNVEALPQQQYLAIGENERPEVSLTLRRGVPILGTILTPDGNPAAGAEVEVRPIGGTRSSHGTADAEGNFALEGFGSSEEYHLQASAQDLISAVLTPVQPSLDLRRELRLLQTVRLSGSVASESGELVPGFTFYAAPVEALSLLPNSRTTSDQTGTFELAKVWPGRFLLKSTLENETNYEVVQPAEIEVLEGQNEPLTVIVRAKTAPIIHGRVRDKGGLNIADVVVTARGSGEVRQGLTDSQGLFELAGLGGDEYSLVLQHPEYQTIVLENQPLDGHALDLRLAPVPLLTLRVVDASTGRPLTTFSTGAVEASRNWWEVPQKSLSPVEASNGTHVLRLPFSGIATVAVAAPSYAMQVLQLDTEAPLKEAVFRLKRGETVRGEVRDSSGNPVVRARVYAGRLPEPLPHGEELALTDSEGRFVLASLPADTQLISAGSNGLAAEWHILGSDDFHSEVLLTLRQPGMVKGRVLRENTPLAGAIVSVTYLPDHLSAQLAGITDDTGTFSIQGLTPGPAQVNVLLDGSPEEIPLSEVLIEEAGSTSVDLAL